MHATRWEFLEAAVVVAFTGSATMALGVPSTGGIPSSGAESGILFEGLIIESRPGVQEATLTQLQDGRYWLLFGEKNRLVGKHSKDQGRSWTETAPVSTAGGSEIPTGREHAHHSMFSLPSGGLGLVYGGPYARVGRDGTVLFRRSGDGGRSWSPPVVVDPYFAVHRNASARVLSTGRIVVPVFRWVSPNPGTDLFWYGGQPFPTSESGSANLAYSWVYYSDDEGQTWHRSLSELLILLNDMQIGAHHFEEPVLEELKDGRLLMYGRTAFGRLYQSLSENGGVSWSVPTPTDLASSYSPCTLVRIPSTGDLLLIWNQISEDEIKAGLVRHRLSCAISRDEGGTWGFRRNLESLDDVISIDAPEDPTRVVRGGPLRQPSDRKRYHRAPGALRVCYPTVVFNENEVAIVYDFGYSAGDPQNRKSATKIKIVTPDWLYGRV